ncbi:MAG: hypothetical protein IKE73_05040 [Bacilli bacterium]|nr:hypothetical protein [Bacilli bacterium]
MKFYKYLEDNKDKIIDIYFDMDGVFVEYDIGNFDYSTIRPVNYVINIMKKLIDDGYNLKVLSVCRNNKIVEEKKEYMDKYVPFINSKDRILLSKERYDGFESNELKSNYLKENTNKEHVSILIDDDSAIIKKVVKENDDVKVFHVSSIID